MCMVEGSSAPVGVLIFIQGLYEDNVFRPGGLLFIYFPPPRENADQQPWK